MSPEKNALIWAGVAILILVGMVAFIIVVNQPEPDSGVAMNTVVPTEAPADDEVAEVEPTEAPADETRDEPAAEDEPAGPPTPTSMSRVPGSITLGSTATPTPTPTPSS